MKSSVLPFGTQSAVEVPSPSTNNTLETQELKTLADLLDRWGANPPKSIRMLRTTCSLLEAYLETSANDILIVTVKETKDGFREFLQKRKYAENSVRTYVNHVRILLKSARGLGWQPSEAVPEDWRGVLAIAAEKKCADVVLHLAKIRTSPRGVTKEDVDDWVSKALLMHMPEIRRHGFGVSFMTVVAQRRLRPASCARKTTAFLSINCLLF
jgi:hypothetical protein